MNNRQETKTLATIMALVKDGQQDICEASRALEKSMTTPNHDARPAKCLLEYLTIRQKERLSFLKHEIGNFKL